MLSNKKYIPEFHQLLQRIIFSRPIQIIILEHIASIHESKILFTGEILKTIIQKFYFPSNLLPPKNPAKNWEIVSGPHEGRDEKGAEKRSVNREGRGRELGG